MTVCNHVRGELGAYVLGALEPDETENVHQHLTHCAECARLHASIAGLPDLLALAEPLETSPPLGAAVEERVLDAVALERGRSRPRRRWLPTRLLVPAIAAAAVIVVAAFVVGEHSGSPSPAPDYARVALHAVGPSRAGGGARLESSAGGTTVHLWVRNLPADPDAVYEVRCQGPHWSASAGTFRTDTHGYAKVVLTTAARRGEYDAISVVRRSRASSTDVLAGSLN